MFEKNASVNARHHSPPHETESPEDRLKRIGIGSGDDIPTSNANDKVNDDDDGSEFTPSVVPTSRISWSRKEKVQCIVSLLPHLHARLGQVL